MSKRKEKFLGTIGIVVGILSIFTEHSIAFASFVMLTGLYLLFKPDETEIKDGGLK